MLDDSWVPEMLRLDMDQLGQVIMRGVPNDARGALQGLIAQAEAALAGLEIPAEG